MILKLKKIIPKSLKDRIYKIYYGCLELNLSIRLSGKSFLNKIRCFACLVGEAFIVLFIIILRPFVLIRFGTIKSDRIGHFALDVEVYLCLKEQETKRKRTIDIIGCPKPTCNNQLQKMWMRTFKITPHAKLWGRLDTACHKWTKSDVHHIQLYAKGSDYRLLAITKPHLYFTDDEEKLGQNLLQQLGIPIDAPWVCMHNRDSAYLKQALPQGNWSYHDYRDFSIQTMIPAAIELVERGYYILRMGKIVAESLLVDCPKIIDYANNPYQSDFADLYLLRHCKFYLGSDSGIFAGSAIFRKPFAFINFPAISPIFKLYYWNSTPFTLKRLWHKKTQRFLSLREIFEMSVDCLGSTHQFDDAGVELVNNTTDEIFDLAIEIDQRLKGEWKSQAKDEELQKQFWNIFQHYSTFKPIDKIKARIGTAFLRKHIDLLN